MTTATVFQYGKRRDTQQEVELPAYVVEFCDNLVNGQVVTGKARHQLAAGEEYGVGSAAVYQIVSGTLR